MSMKYLFYFILSVLIFDTSISCSAQKVKYNDEEVTIVNDGWQLKGNLILMQSKEKFPIVLLLNKANGDRKAYEFLAGKLAQRNISSLRIDLRGHGESTNKGRFIPFDSLNNINLNLENGYTDIIAVYKYLLSLAEIDSNRIGIVGASYSGEQMMIASRKFKYAKSYIVLSPGSFSDESILEIDSIKTNTLFIKSYEEKSMQGFEADVFAKSRKAQIYVVAGKIHATDILLAYPNVNFLIADWLANYL